VARAYKTFQLQDAEKIKRQMLSWASRFNICCFLDNQQYPSEYHSYECLAAVGAVTFFDGAPDFFKALSLFLAANTDWIFGHFNYEAVGKEGQPASFDNSGDHFPVCFLFVPETIVLLQDEALVIGTVGKDPAAIFAQILEAAEGFPTTTYDFNFEPRLSRAEYLRLVEHLKRHIHRGDCYEINFCQQFTAIAAIDPAPAFLRLTDLSPNPFSAFYRIHHHYLLCASPERYLKKTGSKLISQPIKGTSARSGDPWQDLVNKNKLRESKKEQSENVMIVDLVRNDLSKISKEGTVVGEELFGIYSFPHVHQMISTVTGTIEEDISFAEVLKATFPMGSMTGAPKNRVMDLIKQFETGERGIYSGTVGYFTPERDFDFNVVIRSIVYNDKTKEVSFHVGSAITASSDAAAEYEECLLKGKAILEIFPGKTVV
jgi:para-aminobenzoate synthetase component 1